MKYVYFLRSTSHPNQRFIGLTEEARLASHYNMSVNPQTNSNKLTYPLTW